MAAPKGYVVKDKAGKRVFESSSRSEAIRYRSQYGYRKGWKVIAVSLAAMEQRKNPSITSTASLIGARISKVLKNAKGQIVGVVAQVEKKLGTGTKKRVASKRKNPGTRITKDQWVRLGGLSNPKLYRRKGSSGWLYYMS